MLVCVAKAKKLLLKFCFSPVQISAFDRIGVGNFEENKNIGASQALPHIRDIGMFLGNMAAIEASIYQQTGDCCFAGSANSHQANQQGLVLQRFYGKIRRRFLNSPFLRSKEQVEQADARSCGGSGRSRRDRHA